MRKLEWMTLAAISTTAVFIPCGDWDLASGIVSAKAWGELRGRNGEFQLQPAVQTCNDVRNPDSATAIGNVINTNGPIDPAAANVSTDTKTYIRPGWLVALGQGSTLATGAACGFIELRTA